MQNRRAGKSSSGVLDAAIAWWRLLVREVIVCAAGIGILVWQTTQENEPSTVLVVAGCALAGVPIAGIAQRALRPSDEEQQP